MWTGDASFDWARAISCWDNRRLKKAARNAGAPACTAIVILLWRFYIVNTISVEDLMTDIPR